MESLVRGTIGLKRPEKKDWRSDSESGARIWCNRKGDFATRSTPAGLGHSRDAQSQQSYVNRSRRKANRGCARRDNECAKFFPGPGRWKTFSSRFTVTALQPLSRRKSGKACLHSKIAVVPISFPLGR